MNTTRQLQSAPGNSGLAGQESYAPTQLLVLGYGNQLFGDDGIGPSLADAVATWNEPGVRALALPLLSPEIAVELAEAELVVFVDAALNPLDHPRLEPIAPAQVSSALGHAATPAELLELAQVLYGRCPPAWMLSIPAADFALGQNFSVTARRGAERALCLLRHLCHGLAGRPDVVPGLGPN